MKILSVLFIALSLFSFSTIAAEHKKPNILLIMADDMGWSDIGCFGSEVNTPNLDKLAANGVRFTQCYNTSKCHTSRACLVTGTYAQQCNVGKNNGPFENAVYTGEVLQGVGYRTYWSGKHHSTQNPFGIGYDHYWGLRDGACNMFNPGKQRPGEPKPAQKRPSRVWCFDDKVEAPYTPDPGFYTTDAFTDYALKFLEDDKGSEKPFFLYVAYTAPHDPLMAPPEDIAKYTGKYAAGYEKIRLARFERQKQMGLIPAEAQLTPLTGNWESLSASERKIEERTMEVYAAMIDRLDQNIGRLIKKIEEMGQLDNTLILFISDNGASAEVVNIKSENKTPVIGEMDNWKSLGKNWANVGNTPFKMYKNSSMEGGICSPMVAHWPAGIKAKGGLSHRPTHLIDFLATFIDITGAEYPTELRGKKITPLQGESFLSALQGEDKPRTKPIFWQWQKGQAVRQGDWKLVTQDGKNWELYNIAKDRTEMNELSAEYPEKAAELTKMWEDWFKSVNREK